MKRFVLLALIFLLLLPAQAQEVSGLGSVVEAYMEENGLNKDNFSMSYYNTVTGESYAFNDKKFMIAASTYKLPVNMYFYEMEQAGEIESNAYLPRVGDTLDVAHEKSLVLSNNEMSLGMLYTIGDGVFADYKKAMRKYFSMTDEEIDPLYYVDNYYCTNMMMDALKYLYENGELFEEMIGYMKQAQQENYFCAGVTEYEVAHKYGWFDGAVNDVGIIYTDEPFLLAVYTQNIVGEPVLADIAALATQYNVENATPTEVEVFLPVEMIPVEKSEERPTVEQTPVTEMIVSEEPAEQLSSFEWWMIPVALGVLLLGGGTVLLTRKKWMGQMLQDEENTDETEPL